MPVKNSLVQKNGRTPLSVYLNRDAVKNQINNVVGGKNGPRFVSAIVSAVQATPALQECTNPSILSAALLGESLNLSPSPQLGQYYMVPYNNKNSGCKEAQFQLGYKGYIQLAIRSGQYKKMNVLAIKEGELVRFDPLNEEIEVNLIEDEDIRDQTPTIGYYAMFEYVNGFRKAIYWSKKKMVAHADRYSQAFSKEATHGRNPKVSYEDFEAGRFPKGDVWKYSSFWYKDFDGMAYKTMLRQLISKWGIMSIDMISAYESDMGVIREDGSVDYVDNMPADDIVEERNDIVEGTAEEPADPPVQEQEPEPVEEEDRFF